jgi:hypothetical protein
MLTFKGKSIGLALVCAILVAQQAQAVDVEIYNDGELVLWGREDIAGVVEAAVPTYYGSALKGSFEGLEASDKVPGLDSWPLTMVDLVANTYKRPTYQMPDGSTASLGTSVVGSFSYRTAGGLQYIPVGTMAEVFTGGADRLRIVRDGQFGADATTRSTCIFPDPPIGSTTVALTTRFEAQQEISLNSGLLGNDAFRLAGLASMFASGTQYDADAIRWKDPGGVEHVMLLSAATPRDAHLFPSPVEIIVGGYFELVKGTGSSWHPDSPSVRMDLTSLSGITGRVGIQGWLAATTDPNDDSLSLWLEWIDAPAAIPSAAVYEAGFTVTATPPEPIPEPATLTLLAGGGLAMLVRRRSALFKM